MKNNLIEFCEKDEIESILGGENSIKILNFIFSKYTLAIPEPLRGQKASQVKIPIEHISQSIVQAVNGEPAYDLAIDVIKDNAVFEIKSVTAKVLIDKSLSAADSLEVSLVYNTSNLKELSDSEIVCLWKKSLKDKFDITINGEKALKHYLIFVIQSNNYMHLSLAKINLDCIDNIDIEKKSINSYFLENIIEPRFGFAKIYTPRKRIELRLKPLNLVNSRRTINFDITPRVSPQNLYELIENDKFDDYVNNYAHTRKDYN